MLPFHFIRLQLNNTRMKWKLENNYAEKDPTTCSMEMAENTNRNRNWWWSYLSFSLSHSLSVTDYTQRKMNMIRFDILDSFTSKWYALKVSMAAIRMKHRANHSFLAYWLGSFAQCLWQWHWTGSRIHFYFNILFNFFPFILRLCANQFRI